MRHGSLFSGIGGFDLAAEWMGWENVFHCEWNEFGQKVLKHYWPKAISYHDITKTDFTIHRGNIGILTGGFPCQPYSTAGKRKGKEDDRHLWPEMLRAIREIQPTWVVGENVFGLINWSGGLVFHEVQADLEAEGYEVFPYVLPAVSVNAPHRRDRVWFVAYREGNRSNGSESIDGREKYKQNNGNRVRTSFDTNGEIRYATDPNSNGQYGCKQVCDDADTNSAINKTFGQRTVLEEQKGERSSDRFGDGIARTAWLQFPTQSPLCSRDDGISTLPHGETISKEYNMDRTELIIKCLKEGRIEVDKNTGQIFSRMIRGKEGELIELKGSDCNGYLVHSLKYNGIKKQVKAHQVIWIAVNGTYDKYTLQIDHINRDKKDNRIQNLRLVTAKENVENQNRWEGNFSSEEKDLMFLMHFDGHMSFREIAEDFGCSKSRVHQIVSEHTFNKLDNITFPKWRAESIKAYGNAVVPQVVYQIFKTIHDYRTSHSPNPLPESRFNLVSGSRALP